MGKQKYNDAILAKFKITNVISNENRACQCSTLLLTKPIKAATI